MQSVRSQPPSLAKALHGNPELLPPPIKPRRPLKGLPRTRRSQTGRPSLEEEAAVAVASTVAEVVIVMTTTTTRKTLSVVVVHFVVVVVEVAALPRSLEGAHFLRPLLQVCCCHVGSAFQGGPEAAVCVTGSQGIQTSSILLPVRGCC